MGLPSSPAVEILPSTAGDSVSIPGELRSQLTRNLKIKPKKKDKLFKTVVEDNVHPVL